MVLLVYRRKKLPDGWFGSVHLRWHCVQARPMTRLLRAVHLRLVVDRRRMPARARGSAGRASAPSRRACGRCSTRADRGRSRSSRASRRCSHRNGPRFSAWQLVQASLIELPSRSIFTFCDPCGLWQDVHSIFAPLSSPTGMCDERCTLFTSLRWHCTQVSSTVAVLSCAFSDFGAVDAVAGRAADVARVVLAAGEVLVLAAVVARQADLAGIADRQRFRFLIFVLSPPPSTCA